ncbi:MAG: rRNA cytosine-C5-methyltransferase [Bacteroidaceae bacterium]|nr:rRNA cytosine-C5-methyltransferase [Bacteroidaceae bacterium]
MQINWWFHQIYANLQLQLKKHGKLILPQAFIAQMEGLLGVEQTRQLVEALQTEPPVSLRVNWQKAGTQDFHACESVPWCSDGRYLPERPSFTSDPLFHAGCYYVQEASSMFLEQVMRRYVKQSVCMLDLCAAPGGKSTHALSLLPEGSLLIANEIVPQRAQILAENITKWGSANAVVTGNDPSAFTAFENLFDVILTDVPCSGEGMFRKDETAIAEWSPENVALCWQRQRRILSDIWPCLKPGGLLIYSTCTFNAQEDEENVAWIASELGAEVLPVEVPEEWGITGCLTKDAIPVYRFLPHRTKGEGFFMAVLRKQEGDFRSFSPRLSKKKEKQKGDPLPKDALKQAASWMDSSEHEVLADGDTLYAFPREYTALLTALRGSLRILKAGVKVAEVKGRDLIPAHDLVLSTIYHKEAFPQVELTEEQAIAYLRREVLSLPEAPRGYVVVTKKHVPLGLVKNLGSRANNLYPAEWRIRSSYLKSFKSSSMSQNSSE